MRLLPRSLFGQIVLALVVGIVVAQLAGTWLLLDDRSRYAERLRGENAAQRIAGIISVLDGASAEERPRLVRALSVPPTRLSLDEPWQAGGSEAGPDAEAFLRRVARALERPVDMQVLSIRRMPLRGRAEAHPMPPHAERFAERGRPLLMAVAQARLRDGAVVTFRHALPEPARDWPLRARDAPQERLGIRARLAPARLPGLVEGEARRRHAEGAHQARAFLGGGPVEHRDDAGDALGGVLAAQALGVARAVVEQQPGAGELRHHDAGDQRQHDLAEQALGQQPHDFFSTSAASM